VIVLDSSAAADYLLGSEPEASWVEGQLDAAGWDVHAPHLLDVEVLRVLRRFVLAGQLDSERGRLLVELLAGFRLRRYPHVHLLARMWDLRDNFTSADAAYVSLAEALDKPLVTTDGTLARTPGSHAEILAP
jgi:predicted nucleic acid-binding protein